VYEGPPLKAAIEMVGKGSPTNPLSSFTSVNETRNLLFFVLLNFEFNSKFPELVIEGKNCAPFVNAIEPVAPL